MFDFDDIKTWPKNLIDFFDKNSKLFKDFNAREFEINTMSLPARWTAVNSFEVSYQDVLNQLKALTNNLSFCSYHATRLTDEELQEIRQEGLKMSSQSHFVQRLNKAVHKGILSQETADQIVSQNSRMDSRVNQLWFLCGKNSLKFESGIGDFLSYWGGEAMAQDFYEDDAVLKQLHSIGKPYLIKTIINQSECYSTKPEMFIKAYLHASDDNEQKGIDISLSQALEASRIVKIVSVQDKEFLELTGYDKWDRAI